MMSLYIGMIVADHNRVLNFSISQPTDIPGQVQIQELSSHLENCTTPDIIHIPSKDQPKEPKPPHQFALQESNGDHYHHSPPSAIPQHLRPNPPSHPRPSQNPENHRPSFASSSVHLRDCQRCLHNDAQLAWTGWTGDLLRRLAAESVLPKGYELLCAGRRV